MWIYKEILLARTIILLMYLNCNVHKRMFELDERAFNKYHSPIKFIS